MSEAGTIISILGSIDQAIGIGRFLKSADKSIDQAEYKLKASELIEKLVDAKDLLQTNREENIQLRERILVLEQELGKKSSFVFEDGKYWIKSAEGVKDGPFCQKCFDKDGKQVRLQKDNVLSRGDYWRCTTCSQTYDYPRADYYSQRESGGGLSNWM